MGTSKYKAQDFIDAMPGTGGIIASIARRVGCEWDTAKKWVTEYPTVNRAWENEKETMADMAESVILKDIKGGDGATAKWYLSRIRRGKYATREEHTGADEGPLTVRVVYGDSDQST